MYIFYVETFFKLGLGIDQKILRDDFPKYLPAKEPILINYFIIPIHSKITFYSTNFTILVCDWCLGSSARRCKLCHSKSQVQTNSVWSRKCWRYFITYSDPTVQEIYFNDFCFSFRYCVQCWRNDRRLGYISSFEVTNSRLSRYVFP